VSRTPGRRDLPALGRRDSSRKPPLFIIFAVTLTGILGNTLIVAPLPDIIADFDLADSAAGLLVAAGSLPGIVIAPIVGLLADRYGRKRVLIPCLVIFGAAGVAAAFAPTFLVLLACRVGQGIGSAGLINLAVVLIADSWHGEERAKLIGQNAAVLTVSVALFPAFGGALAEAGGWRWSFAPYSIALLTAVGVAWLVPEHLGAEITTVRRQIGDAVAVIRQPRVAASIGFGAVVFVLIFGLFLTALPLLLDQRFGLGPAARGFVLAAPAAGSTVVALSLGKLRGRFGARRLLLAATMAFTVAFAVIGFAPLLVIALAGALVYGLGEGASIPTLQDLVSGSAPAASRGAVVAAWVSAARLGQTIGPLGTAVLLGVMSPGSVFLVGALIAGALVVAQLTFRLPTPVPEPLD